MSKKKVTKDGRSRKVWAIGGVGAQELCEFTRELATLLDAGIAIVKSLQLIEKGTPNGVLKNALIDVAQDVENGDQLAAAMEKHPRCFNKAYVNVVRASETYGGLPEQLLRMASELEKAQSLRRKVVSAMIYPALVITVAVAIVTGIMVFIIPKFAKIFAEMSLTLPGMTKALISVSTWFGHYWWALPIFALALWGIWKVVRMTRSGLYATDRLLLWIPVIGPMLDKAQLARTTRLLGTLTASHVSLLESLLLVRDICTNEVYARMYYEVYLRVKDGGEIWETLEAAQLVKPTVVTMVKIGEEAGKLDTMLLKVADMYEERLDHAVQRLTSVLEPIMIVSLGLAVGMIVVSLFLPLVKLLEGLSK